MTAILSSIKAHFVNWRHWELNPVVVKELRQAVRSWAVTGMLLLFLGVLFCTSLAFLVSQSFSDGVNQRLGATVFQAFVVILGGASIVFIPLYVGIRLAAERQASNLDLLYISTLTPGSIIRGKFFCGAYTALLFFSACMPFMTFTNLLRGIDLPSVFLILMFLFLVVCAAVQVAIFLACLPISRPFKILLALGGCLVALMLVLNMVMFSFRMMYSGVGAMVMGRDFWTGFVTITGVALAGVGFLYFLSVALISPLSANRAFAPRVYMTACWLLSLGLSLLWIKHEKDLRLILGWAFATILIMAPTLIVLVSNHDELSSRVRRDIPATGFKRLLAFLFFNGAAGGLVWAALLLGATIAIATTIIQWGGSLFTGAKGWSGDTDKDISQFAAVMGYVFSYVLTGLFVHRRFFRRRPPKLAGVMAILIAAALALVPNVILFFLNRLSWRTVENFQPGNVFNVFVLDKWEERWMHVGIAVGWLLLMLALNAGWFRTQWKNFRPLDRRSQPTATPPEIPPPLPQSTAQA